MAAARMAAAATVAVGLVEVLEGCLAAVARVVGALEAVVKAAAVTETVTRVAREVMTEAVVGEWMDLGREAAREEETVWEKEVVALEVAVKAAAAAREAAEPMAAREAAAARAAARAAAGWDSAAAAATGLASWGSAGAAAAVMEVVEGVASGREAAAATDPATWRTRVISSHGECVLHGKHGSVTNGERMGSVRGVRGVTHGKSGRGGDSPWTRWWRR